MNVSLGRNCYRPSRPVLDLISRRRTQEEEEGGYENDIPSITIHYNLSVHKHGSNTVLSFSPL
jgi:hypothetical protein